MGRKEREKEQDREIQRLRGLVRLHAARSTQAHARLSATQLALDVMQAQHDEELSSVHQEKRVLEAQILNYKRRLGTVERECDDMREAVNQLIDKVAQQHDFGVWPTSKMRISTFLDPLLPESSTSQSEHWHTETEAYAASMIQRLSSENDSQKRELERAQWERKVLNAQFALRDVNAVTGETEPDLHAGELEVIDEDQALEILEGEDSRQRALELEIEGLRRRVQNRMVLHDNDQDQDYSEDPRNRPPRSPSHVSPIASTSRRHLPQEESEESDSPSSPLPVSHVDALAAEVRDLRYKIEEFHSEREMLLRMIEEAKAEAEARQADLTVTQSQIQAVPPVPELTADINLLDSDDGEMSMELATPLFPTTSLPPLFP